MRDRMLFAWIGSKDLAAASGDTTAALGPIAQAVEAHAYTDIHLLSNDKTAKPEVFVKWLASRSSAKIRLHVIPLTSPTRHGEIYEGVVSVLEKVRSNDVDTTYHLSPGTPAMHSVWLLLAKTTHPARLIQSSPEAGVEDAEIPFDISAEFIPQLLQHSDRQLTNFAQGSSDQDAEFSNIIHRSPTMKRVIQRARRVAPHGISVLIEGESGTGKELMARAIHNASGRKGKFLPVNCGAIPPELAESEFFGHVAGAFSGAKTKRDGHFVTAYGGTLFLDEIGELPKPLQAKLLRSLQEGTVTPVGSSDEIKTDVRIIAATNRTLIDEVAAGRFREDLFYRIAVDVIKLPPLRERQGDVLLLVENALAKANANATKIGFGYKKLSVQAKNLLIQHRWPGNIREMNNTIQRAAVWSDEDTIGLETMRDAILVSPKPLPGDDEVLGRPIEAGVPLEDLLARVARHYLKRALEHTHNNKTQAAALLALGSYQTLTNWMSKYQIEN